MQSQEYLNTKQAAERYGLSESWLSKLRIFGGGSPHLKVGRRVLYERSEFERWLASHRRLTTSEQPAKQKSRPGLLQQGRATACSCGSEL
jgi:excisionase family DNA binding protein